MDGVNKSWPLIAFDVKPASKIELTGTFGSGDDLHVNIPGGNEHCLFAE